MKVIQASRPLNDARYRISTRLYEEYRNRSKADIAAFRLPYTWDMKIASFNARSLLKPTMHQQIVTYMRNTNIQVLCLQETKSRTTSQYVVDDFIVMTISAADAQQQEYAGVEFVLNPKARNALLRTS